MKNSRLIALEIIYDIQINGGYSNLTIEKHFKDIELSIEDKNFIREIVYGTIENDIYLNWVIELFSKIKLKKISEKVLILLKLSIYQLIFLEKVPQYSICDEANKIATKVSNIGAKKFVNGILRSIIREKDTIEDRLEEIKNRNFEEYLGIKYSMPIWIIKRWINQYGEKDTCEILEYFVGKPDFCIRVNTLKIDREELLLRFESYGIKCDKTKYADDGIKIDNPNNITNLEEFKKGMFIIQDESSMLVAQAINPKSDEVILDMCSAPGGKTTHISQKMRNEGLVIARDIHAHKIKLIDANCKRLGITNVQSEIQNSLEINEKDIKKYDTILLDAPCSGFGIIKRKPEIKYNRTEQDLEDIIKLQEELIENAYAMLKKGGILLYSTCSIDAEENKMQIAKVLDKKMFELVSFEKEINIDGAEKGYVQIIPYKHNMDGFFIAKLRKIGE